MSLINEALRRAEREKTEKTAPATESGLLPPLSRRRRTWSSHSLVVKLMISLALFSAGFAAFQLWRHAESTPTAATAAVSDRTPRSDVTKPRPSSPAPVPVVAAPAKSDPSEKIASSEPVGPRPAPPPKVGPIELKLGEIEIPPEERWEQVLQDLIPPADEAVEEPDVDLAGSQEPSPYSEDEPTTRPAGDQERPEETPTTQPAEDEQEAAAPPPPPPPSGPQFKVSCIMLSPDGPVAIINGRALLAGEKIGPATVVKITRKTVTLDVSGKELTLGL